MTANVQLTPFTNVAVTIYSTSANMTFNIIYTPYWSTKVTVSTTSAVNTRDMGNGIATFKTGLTVNLKKTSTGGYNLSVSGNIIDNGETYTFTNFPIGSYTS